MSPKTTRRGIANWRAWKFELWALVGSVLSFAIMVIILAIFDGRPIFEWKSDTLNAIISVLSVVIKASLTFAVAELIGQWKWILFSRGERPLMDFERIDMATRGPWGNLRVMEMRYRRRINGENTVHIDCLARGEEEEKERRELSNM